MGTKERRERERSETRDKILDAARELFTSQGYDRVSMRQIADKIEYTPTTIYGYFPDKETLFLELCHTDFHRLAESVSQLAVVADPVERLKLLGRSYIEFGINNPNHYRMMFMTAHPEVNEQYTDLLGRGNPEEDSYAFLKNSVEEACRAGAFREELTDPELISQTLWAGVHGVVSLQIAKGCDGWVPWTPLDKRIDAMIDGIFTGLLKKGE